MDDLGCLDAIKTGLILVTRDYRIIKANTMAMQILGALSGPDTPEGTCHHLLFQKSSPCRDCPCIKNDDPVLKHRSTQIRTSNNKEIFIKEYFSFYGNNILLTIHDVTREIAALRHSELSGKELHAKNIILKQKDRTAKHEIKEWKDIFDHFTDLLVTVDASFKINKCNAAVLKSNGGKKPEMCYEVVGRKVLCESCPANRGFEYAAGNKKSHKVDDRFYTEEFSPFPSGKGGILFFRDTTRQIQLIQQIREQREIITDKNKLFSGLFDIEAKMHKETDPKTVLEYFVEIFLPLYKTDECAIIVSDIRLSSVWFTINRGLQEGQMKDISRAFISREIQTSQVSGIPQSLLPWEETLQFELIGGNNRIVGIVLLKKSTEADAQELINLFKEPLSAYIHNKLLMRQLEERANTDTLTGLYNRAYIDTAVAEEENKFHELNIHFSVVMVDVNGLKKANDLYGHEVGDRLLTAVGERLKSATRNSDVVARTGGDEFIILLTGTPDEGAHKFIKRLSNEFFKDVFLEIGDQKRLEVTVSLGAAGTDKFPLHDLIKQADRFMYEDKTAYYAKHPRYR